MNNKRLYRDPSDKMLGGVCSGLADFFGIDPTVVRLAFVLLTLLGGHGVLIYLVLWLIVPLAPQAAAEAVVDVPPAPPTE